MRAVSRLGLAMVAASLALAPVAATAQTAQPSTTPPPATDTIGPRELQNFSLGGTVTRQADTPPPAARPARQPPAMVATSAQRAPGRTAEPVRRAAERSDSASRATQPPAATPSLSLTTTPAQPAPQPSFTDAALPPPSIDAPPASLAPEHNLMLWPWLLLAAVAGGAVALLLWRRRSREAFAGEVDAYVAPDPPAPAPAPRPVPVPAPVPKPAAKPVGIVSTKLRPWLDISFVPLGCVIDDQQMKLEFQLDILNTGGAPARDILVEASMFNAGPTQDDDMRAFFAKPAGGGDRIESIPPLQRVTFTHALVATVANLQLFELGGKQVFVPLVAFNALYRWSGGEGQTSSSYLVGGQTRTDKLAPLRADRGARAIAGLAAHPLPTGLRD